MLSRSCASMLAVLIGLCGAAGAAHAAIFTTVNPPPPGEHSHQQILSNIYGGSFVQVGPDYTNGTITATRVADGSASADPLDLIADGEVEDSTVLQTNDELWRADFRRVTAQARFAMYHQSFGYFDGASGGSFVELFHNDGSGYAVAGEATLNALNRHTIRWARGGQDRVMSSKSSDNLDGQDHMVTYRIDGLGDGLVTWLLFFEDVHKNEGTGSDFDFNDLVVEVKAAPVPEPAAGLVVAGAAALLLSRRRLVAA